MRDATLESKKEIKKERENVHENSEIKKVPIKF